MLTFIQLGVFVKIWKAEKQGHGRVFVFLIWSNYHSLWSNCLSYTLWETCWAKVSLDRYSYLHVNNSRNTSLLHRWGILVLGSAISMSASSWWVKTILLEREKYEVTGVLACGQCPRAFCNCEDVNSLWPCIKELFIQLLTVCLGFLLGKYKLQGKILVLIKNDVP